MVVRLTAVALFCSFGLNAALAAPSRIIILCHGEKEDVWKLCGIGRERAAALAANCVGRKPFFCPGDGPAAFLAITLQTLELAAPAATTGSLPLTLYPVMPPRSTKTRPTRR